MPSDEAILETGVEAVIYGLPLVMMELTMRPAVNVESPRGMAAPVNQFSHVRQFPPASFKQVVRVNVDTLYSSAFLDLSKEPLILSLPDTRGRYYLFPMFDAWTNVFATPGTRTTGNGPGHFAIVGPRWRSTLPGDFPIIEAPTNTVWVLGRTQTNGPADYEAVHALQNGYELVPLSAYGRSYTPPKGTVDPGVDAKTPPVKRLASLTTAAFFTMLARLLKANPPPAEDVPMLAKLASIGVVPGQAFDPSHVSSSAAIALVPAVKVALRTLQESDKTVGHFANHWLVPDMNVGRYGTDYRLRAFIALVAFGANLAEDAIYPTTYADADGKPLDGASRYVLRFAAGALPPVRAFWSVTAYDAESFFEDNPIHRFAISSWMPLQRGADGSVELRVQHASPGEGAETNWLPVPAGAFNLTMRMYWPSAEKPSVLDGTWAPPAVTKVG